MLAPIAPRGLDQKPGSRPDRHAVQRRVKDEGPASTEPPIERRQVFRPGLPIFRIAGKPELDIVSRQLSDDGRQISGQVVSVGRRLLPPPVPLRPVRIDVREDPPLITGQQRIALGQPGQKTGQTAQEDRSDRLVGVAARQQAYAPRSPSETESTNRPALAGPADFATFARIGGTRGQNGRGGRQPLGQVQVVRKVSSLTPVST